MSGHYPPHDPYGRTPASPWGHSHPRHSQSHPPGMVWSPHVGMPARGQMWAPKPIDSRPLYGLPMMVSTPQQEETMDLSASAQDVPLRNGTINGETSVIAPNPINCSKRVVGDVWESTDCVVNVSKPDKNQTSPGTIPGEKAVDQVLKNDSLELDRLSDFNFSVKPVTECDEQTPQRLQSEHKNDCDPKASFVKEAEKSNESHSFLENSYLSVDTDESRLVVAESSTDDIFGISPVQNTNDLTSQVYEKSEKSSVVIPTVTSSKNENSTLLTLSGNSAESENSTVVISSGIENISLKATQIAAGLWQCSSKSEISLTAIQQESSGPNPSVENVEILLESMFNSQEETCSSQVSAGGVSQSVIVPNGANTEPCTPLTETIMPMKEEELAKTLAEDILPDSKEESLITNIKDESEGQTDIKDLLDSVTEEPKIVIVNIVPDQPNTVKEEVNASELENREESKLNVESKHNTLPNCVTGTQEIGCEFEDQSMSNSVEKCMPSLLKPCLSSNPFIEVESELEKMFAGIVEGGSSDTLGQPLCSEPNKLATNKKPTRKRKKTNTRRHSDNSFFDGSSGEGIPLRKKCRKSASGSEKGPKKLKMDYYDGLKKGKLIKEMGSDVFSSKVKGPFVHIEGSKESPANVVVVNSGSRGDDEEIGEKPSARWKHSKHQKREGGLQRSGAAYSASTLSMRYNSDTPDITWVCVFCKRGPHCNGGLGDEPAGDLFGPYRVPLTPPNDDVLPPGTPSDQDISEEQKKRSGGKIPKSMRTCGPVDSFVHKVAKKGKRSSSEEALDQPGLLLVDECYEVWLHEQCAVWAPGLYLIGSQLIGLDSVIWTALRTKCWQCGSAGAELGCVVHNCPIKMHYPCAKISGWALEHDTFIARCHTHRTRLRL